MFLKITYFPESLNRKKSFITPSNAKYFMQDTSRYPTVKLKCFQITKLQSVATLNQIKLKTSLEYNSILIIT